MGIQKKKVALSIIIPNLNDATGLVLFLDSLKANYAVQLARHPLRKGEIELVIVDGDSVDGSRNAILSSKIAYHMPLTFLIDTTRNLGYIRNLGAKYARGEILFFTNSDVYLPRALLSHILRSFLFDPQLVALSGRTQPLGKVGAVGHIAYVAFDLLRWFFSRAPPPLRAFCPGGSFIAVRARYFWAAAGFPMLPVNEDAGLGHRLKPFIKRGGVHFDLSLWVGHWAKRFEGRWCTLKSLVFYSYLFRNFFPFLNPILKRIEARSGRQFQARAEGLR